MKGKVRYQRELQKTYMLVRECKTELMDSYAGRMVMRGTVKGLLECHKYVIDGEWEIRYDITSLQSLEQLFAVKEMGFSELRDILLQLMLLLEEMEKCLLSDNQLCFSPQYVFMDMERQQLRFLYDYSEQKENSSLCELGEYLLEKINHEDKQAVELAYSFYEHIQKESFSVKELEVFFQETKETEQTMELHEEPESYEAMKPEVVTDIRENLKKEFSWDSVEGKILEGGLACICMGVFSVIGYWIVQRFFVLSRIENSMWVIFSIVIFAAGACLTLKGVKKEKIHQSPQAVPDVAADEKIIGEAEFHRCMIEDLPKDCGGKTVYVGNALLNRDYCLVERHKGEEKRHPISSYPFYIGKEKGRVNLMIKDISVSRIHAGITEENGEIYIEDLHSTNGTYLNDMLLESHKRTRLKKGDILQFGKTEFLLY